MHAVRRELLQKQADCVGLPLWTVPLPWPCSNEQYEARMQSLCERAVSEGVQAVAFGDLFLADIRTYREKQLAGTGLQPLFPVWHIPTSELARTMIDSGLRARITCIDPRVLPAEFAGRAYDTQLLADLPPGIDPCGENGEFHTFVYDSPDFSSPIAVTTGKKIERDGFVFADIVPVRTD